MSNKLTPIQLTQAAEAAGFEARAVRAVIQVETGGSGYDSKTGYLLIQFEPSWFRRLLPKKRLAEINVALAARKSDNAAFDAWRLATAKVEAINAKLAVADRKPLPPKPMFRTTEEQSTLIVCWEIVNANQVEGQPRERIAFNAAVRIDARTAQLATSWGLPQMMGFNHVVCGYKTVEQMVEAFRVSEANQVAAMLTFIKSKKAMAGALKKRDWGVLAYYYNGPAYKTFKYDTKLAAAYASLA